MTTCKQELSCIRQLVTFRVTEPLCDAVPHLLCFSLHLHWMWTCFSQHTSLSLVLLWRDDCFVPFQMSVLVPLFCYGLSLFTLHRNYCVCAGISLFPCNKSKPTMKQVQSACTHLSSCSALNKGVRQRAFMGFVRIWCETALKCFRCKVEQFMPVYQCCLFVQHKWETCATLSALTVLSGLAMAPCPVRATFFLFHTNSHFSVSGGMPCHSLPASVVRHVILLSNAPQTSP